MYGTSPRPDNGYRTKGKIPDWEENGEGDYGITYFLNQVRSTRQIFSGLNICIISTSTTTY
jgi:hypothetical protein